MAKVIKTIAANPEELSRRFSQVVYEWYLENKGIDILEVAKENVEESVDN